MTYYQAYSDTSSFYVIYAKATRDNEEYEILIDLRVGPDYHRTMTVYKDGKPHTLILWFEKTLLKSSKVKAKEI